MPFDRKKYLLETVLPDAAKEGRFGNGLRFVRCETSGDGQTGDQFASAVVFTTAVMGGETVCDSNDVSKFKLVIKFLPDNIKMREIMNSDIQFSNEIAMYSEILPFLNYNNIVQNLFPTFFCGKISNQTDIEPVVVIEDLRNQNFGLSKQKIFFDFNHIVLALKALGKFHALSYIMKQQKPLEFNEIKQKLQEHIWLQVNNSFSFTTLIEPSALRGIKTLCAIQNDETLEKLSETLETDTFGLMKYFVNPDEPTAVICHGDFCNHNMLFKYEDSLSDIPESVRFIDLQTSRYASPVVDLSMILLLNTEPELRLRHWDEFIKAYYDSLNETVTAAECIPPSFADLQHELKNKMFYGYCHCSYFLPLLVSKVQLDVDEAIKLEPKTIVQTMLELGGEKGTQYLVSILKFLQDKKYFGFLKQ